MPKNRLEIVFVSGDKIAVDANHDNLSLSSRGSSGFITLTELNGVKVFVNPLHVAFAREHAVEA